MNSLITLVTATMVSTSPLQKGRSCSAVPWKLYLAMHSVPDGQVACRTGYRWAVQHPPAHKPAWSQLSVGLSEPGEAPPPMGALELWVLPSGHPTSAPAHPPLGPCV